MQLTLMAILITTLFTPIADLQANTNQNVIAYIFNNKATLKIIKQGAVFPGENHESKKDLYFAEVIFTGADGIQQIHFKVATVNWKQLPTYSDGLKLFGFATESQLLFINQFGDHIALDRRQDSLPKDSYFKTYSNGQSTVVFLSVQPDRKDGEDYFFYSIYSDESRGESGFISSRLELMNYKNWGVTKDFINTLLKESPSDLIIGDLNKKVDEQNIFFSQAHLFNPSVKESISFFDGELNLNHEHFVFVQSVELKNWILENAAYGFQYPSRVPIRIVFLTPQEWDNAYSKDFNLDAGDLKIGLNNGSVVFAFRLYSIKGFSGLPSGIAQPAVRKSALDLAHRVLSAESPGIYETIVKRFKLQGLPMHKSLRHKPRNEIHDSFCDQILKSPSPSFARNEEQNNRVTQWIEKFKDGTLPQK